MSKRVVAAALLASGLATAAFAQQGPHLGVPVSEADIAAWDISIGPSGAGLPQGSGTASAGASVYATKCIACHGEKGAGKPSDQLVGGRGTLKDPAPVRTVGSYWPYATTLFDYIRRAMPWPQPQSLTPDEIYAVTAYILFLNGVIGENDVMNAATLPKVVMPNRDNFDVAYHEPRRR
ncbi:MAG TPA: cytochrome c [Gammaproteobacteria bacterium]|jgi:cytochrome c|nr:cytochrome c [Gammaproteobacteria bacterium]